jgi:hypothetical protein
VRDAIGENRLVLYSQPIVPLAGGRPSLELLLRMVGPGGATKPDRLPETLCRASVVGWSASCLVSAVDLW